MGFCIYLNCRVAKKSNTPAMFWLFGRKPAEALMDDKDAEAL